MHERDIEPPPRRQLRPFSKLQRASPHLAAHTGCCPSSYPRTSNFSPASAPRRRGPLRPPPEVERRTTAPICRIMGTPASCSSNRASVRTVLRTISTLSGAHSRTFAPLPAGHAAGMASCERSGSGRTLDDILRSQYEWAGRLWPSKPKTKTLQARHHRTVTFCPTSDSERTRCSQLD